MKETNDMSKVVDKYRRQLMEYQKLAEKKKASRPDAVTTSVFSNNSIEKASQEPFNRTIEKMSEQFSEPKSTPAFSFYTEDIGEISNQETISDPKKLFSTPVRVEYVQTDIKNMDQFEVNNTPPLDISLDGPSEAITDWQYEAGESSQNIEMTEEIPVEMYEEMTEETPVEISETSEMSEEMPKPPQQETEDANNLFEDYINQNLDRGFIFFQVSTIDNAVPIKGAKVQISKDFGNRTEIFYELETDESGRTAIVPIPAPPKQFSLVPELSAQPFATYDATIKYGENGIRKMYNIPVFAGMTSIQPYVITPSPDDQQPETIFAADQSFRKG